VTTVKEDNMAKLKLTQEQLDDHLIRACKQMNFGYAQVSIAAGANVNTRTTFEINRDVSPLHLAVSSKYANSEIVQLLLAHGADPSSKNSAGQTPADKVVGTYPVFTTWLADAAKQQGHTGRVTAERKDKGPPQVGG
jgi:hypothetical protein